MKLFYSLETENITIILQDWFWEGGGDNHMRKLEIDHIDIIPKTCITLKSIPRDFLISRLLTVASAPFTVNSNAVTNCAALFS